MAFCTIPLYGKKLISLSNPKRFLHVGWVPPSMDARLQTGHLRYGSGGMFEKQEEHTYDPHFPHPRQNFGKRRSRTFMGGDAGSEPGSENANNKRLQA